MKALIETLFDQIRSGWRFRWMAMAVAWAVCVLGWIVVMLMPNTYEASARIFVDTRTTLSQVTKGLAVDSNVDSQIHGVREALLGGPQLQKVADEAHLIPPNLTPQQRQILIAKLRDSIVLTGGSGDSESGSAGGLYVISYRHTNRAVALAVVDKLVNSFVDNTLGGKRAGSEQAQRFLVDQIRDYEKRLSTAEERRASFKKQYVGLMPGQQGGGYFARLQSEMEAATRATGQLDVAISRRDELRRQLRGEQPTLPSVPVATTQAPAGNAGASGAPSDTGARIRETQARLDDLLLRFTEKHPDVIALRATLAELEARRREEVEAVRRGDPGAVASIGLSANPVFQNIQLDLNRTEVEIAALRGELETHQRTVVELKRLVDTAPEVEAEFAKLDRDYDVTYAQYKALVERLERARLSEQAEETGVVHFEVIDPPASPFSPVSPPRAVLFAFVLLAGLGAGGGLAYLLSQMKPVFSNAKQLGAVTGLPVLGAVSMTWLETYTAQGRRGVLAYVCVAGLLFVVGAGTFIAQNRLMQLFHQWTG